MPGSGALEPFLPSPSCRIYGRSWEGAFGNWAIPVEDRPFHPHVTLVRFRYPISIAPPQDRNKDFRYPIDAVALYESHTDPKGSRYEILKEFPLAPQPVA